MVIFILLTIIIRMLWGFRGRGLRPSKGALGNHAARSKSCETIIENVSIATLLRPFVAASTYADRRRSGGQNPRSHRSDHTSVGHRRERTRRLITCILTRARRFLSPLTTPPSLAGSRISATTHSLPLNSGWLRSKVQRHRGLTGLRRHAAARSAAQGERGAGSRDENNSRAQVRLRAARQRELSPVCIFRTLAIATKSPIKKSLSSFLASAARNSQPQDLDAGQVGDGATKGAVNESVVLSVGSSFLSACVR